MTDREKCTWNGKSGTSYVYYVYSLPTTFDPNQVGNYIYTKKNQTGQWFPIYIGQGDLRERVSDSHHRASCIKARGASHVHAHLSQGENTRKGEEADLLANYTNAYQPYGCNEREGG